MFSPDTIEALSFIGAPYALGDICLIHPLSVGDVLGAQDKYDIYLQLITVDRSFMINHLQGKNLEVEQEKLPTPLEFILLSAAYDDAFNLELQTAVSFFIKEPVTILHDIKSIVIGDPSDKRIIDETNFLELQNVIRIQNKMPPVEAIPENESPMAKKFREKRELRDAVKKKQTQADAPKFQELMSAICTYNIGVTPFNIKNLSLFAFYDLLQVNGSKERYEAEMHFLYGGADPKKLKPKYWIGNQNK